MTCHAWAKIIFFIVSEGDELVHKMFQVDPGAMTMCAVGEDGNFAMPMMSSYLRTCKYSALAHGANEMSTQQLADLQFPTPENLLPAYGDALPLVEDGSETMASEFLCTHGNLCFIAAEVLVQLERYEEALAHNARNMEHSTNMVMIRTSPWQRARILAAQRTAKGTGAPWTEIVALFEKTVAEGIAWGAPLIVVFALKDMLALVPASELGDAASVRSRLEEYISS